MQFKRAQPWFDATGFIPNLEVLNTGKDHTAFVLGRFSLDRFRSGLFEHFQLECPARLTTAIPKRKAEFLAGRLAVRYGFQQLCLPDLPVPQREDRAPAWPDGLIGSISHSGHFCAALISLSDQGLAGVDIEEIAHSEAAEAIRTTALTQTEQNLCEKAIGLSANESATLIFSAKESLFKALYIHVGYIFGFECAEVVYCPSKTCLQLCLTQDLTSRFQAGARFDVSYQFFQGHVLTWLHQIEIGSA